MRLLPLLVVLVFATLGCAIDAWVVALDKQSALWDRFRAEWSRKWVALNARRFQAVKRETRGHGVCLSIRDALMRDEAAAPQHPSLLFEVDALPFGDVDYDAVVGSDIASLQQHAIYFLGGHHVVPRGPFRGTVGDVVMPWTPIQYAYGCYGLLVPARSRAHVIDKLTPYCERSRVHYDVDVFLSECFDAVVATPLLVDHPRIAYSETWHRNATREWAGSREWWRTRGQKGLVLDCAALFAGRA